MKRVMSEAKMLRLAAEYGVTGTQAAIIRFCKMLLKDGSDADVVKTGWKELKI